MRVSILLPFLMLSLYAQHKGGAAVEGKITFISSQNFYVQFESTEGLQTGDTLYVVEKTDTLPGIIIRYLSTRSLAGEKVGKHDAPFTVGQKFIAFPRAKAEEKPVEPTSGLKPRTFLRGATGTKESAHPDEMKWQGRVSLLSASDFTSGAGNESQRWRGSVNLTADNFFVPKLSLTNYMLLSFSGSEWKTVKKSPFNNARVYDLALSYRIDSVSTIWGGRHLNYRMANAGTVDGLQFETSVNSFMLGVVVGSRPSITDNGVDLNLLQVGGYAARIDRNSDGVGMENTLAFLNQTYKSKTDRRFLYLQHSNNFLTKTDIFVSSEVDLYKVESGTGKSALDLTSVYSSVRYTPIRELSLSLSYDARRNVVYYETYKTYLDSLFSNDLLKGLRWNVTCQPFGRVSIGLNGSLQSQMKDSRPSQNYGMFAYFSGLPWIGTDATLNATTLTGSYLKGMTGSLELSKNVLEDMYASIGYRTFQYEYSSSGTKYVQNVLFGNVSFALLHSVMLSLNYEGVYEKSGNGNRLYIDLTKRF